MSIRVGILGYGNLGKGVESAIAQNDDMELKAVFTRRNPENVKFRYIRQNGWHLPAIRLRQRSCISTALL